MAHTDKLYGFCIYSIGQLDLVWDVRNNILIASTPSSPRHRKNSVTSRTRTSHSLEPRHNGAHGHMGSTSVTTPSFSVSNVSAEGTGIAGSGQDSQIKFAITSQSLNNQKASMDEQYMSGKATTFNSAAIYNPMPTVGGRSSELANTFFAVEHTLDIFGIDSSTLSLSTSSNCIITAVTKEPLELFAPCIAEGTAGVRRLTI
ncbi:unnamed protein product [Schistocephalus solidus]|uniref:Nucleoporin_N domain-containing protein n=1 Tax=Schistocephalus solidus TaxID=70667 RepID=A0A183TME3_SCHSO|nr:unnamed protein product [Schistocephalus solidus]